ncbi:MAG: hypothetical protein R2774_13070 [Saprospiraceae bacterium]
MKQIPVIVVLVLLCIGNIFGQWRILQPEKNGVSIKNENLINSSYLESSPCFWGDQLVFMFSGVKSKLFDQSIDESYFDLGFCKIDTFHQLFDRQIFQNK